MANYEEQSHDSEKVKAWTAALSQVPNKKGHHYHIHKGNEIDHVKEIAEKVHAKIAPKPLLVGEKPVGLDQQIEEDMGREIIRQEEPNNPAKRSRLWLQEEVINVLLANDTGSDAIQGIVLYPPERITDPKHLPNYLRLLDWKFYPSKTFPPKFYPKDVIILKLPNGRLKLEEPFKQFSCLTVMNFSNNKYITTMPDVSEVENLRELRLDYCLNLTMVHESIGSLKNLVHFSASECKKLEIFLRSMFLPSLEVLNLDWCEKLEHFPEIENKMIKPLKIHMIGTSVKKLPNSVGNLTGLVSMDMQYSENLEYLPSSLFKLPNVVAFDFGGCSKLGESFKIFLPHSPSTLKKLHFEESGLSDEDVQAILTCFPKLEELIVYKNNLVSLPACIKESTHLANLDVSDCKKLKEIPECTNLRIMNVHGCMSLTHISELPCTIKKVDARKCFNFSSETSNMLWDQVKKEGHVFEIVMPGVKVPKWFNYIRKDEILCFWVRGKFPNVSLALVFQYADGKERINQDLVQLHLVINGQLVPHKDYNNFIIEPHHVLVCDLRLLYNDEEWLSIDALLQKHEWNQVQISYEFEYSHVTLSEWGVFVYKQGTDNLEAVNLNEQSDDLWEMLEAAKGEEQENNECNLNETVKNDEELMEIGNNNSSEQSERKLPATTTVPSVMEFIAQPNSECHKESVTGSYVMFETEASGKMKIKGSDEETTTVEDPNLFKEEECSQTRGDQGTILDPEPPSEPPYDDHRVVSIQQSETIDDEIGLSMTKSPWVQPTGEQALLKEEVRLQKIQVMRLLVTIAPPAKSPYSVKPSTVLPQRGPPPEPPDLATMGWILAKSPRMEVGSFRISTELFGVDQQAMNGEHNCVAFEGKAHSGLCLKFKSYFSWCDSLANESVVSLIYWLIQESSTCWKYTLMPTVTVAIMMPNPEALDYVFRKQVNFFNKDSGMQLRGQVGNNVSFYVLPISAVYSGWQTLKFWILKIEERKLNSLSIKAMKFILLVINGKYRDKEIASSLHEIDHVKEIAGKVGANIAPKPLHVGENPVGLDQRIEEVKSLLDLKPKDNTVCFLGIIGIGGIGKTELAKALYNEIVHQFVEASFLANVREKLKKINGLKDLEKQLEKHMLGRKNVLLVLDDVDEIPGNLNMGREIVRQEAANNPAKFNPMKVIILSLLDSQLITMEEPFKQFSCLTILDFSHNQFIATMPDVSKVENLRELRLDYCSNLTTVHESIGFLKHLVHLSVSECHQLENFLQRMFLPSLEVLKLDWCRKLKHFPHIENEMNTPLKIHMMDTSIKKLPNSVGNLLGLISIKMRYSKNLEHLPSCLFKLPNVIAFDFGYCPKLGESFRRLLPHSPSEDNERSALKVMHLEESGLLDEDIEAILTCFPKLEELNVSYNYNLVSLPMCIKESNHLKNLNVSGCRSLTHISELPCTIQKIEARECFNISSKTSHMLWDQLKKERHGLKFVIPGRYKVPKWFDYRCNEGIPCLWVRGKFPINVDLSLVFQAVDGKQSKDLYLHLHLVINGQSVPRNSHKEYYDFQIDVNHVIVCDLQLLYNDEEWLSIDALLLKHEWNQVQISYEASDGLPLSEWGVFVYKQGRTVNLEEHVQFMCPDPTRYSNIANTAVPPHYKKYRF
ncbi:hypothetical protein P8452_49347 [Trifolium repens]|nr:hypothetical protein P8452_49347 [Trifolium repens]